MWDDVVEMINEMVSRGILLDVCIYNILISCFCKDNKLSEVIDVYGLMIDKGLEFNL